MGENFYRYYLAINRDSESRWQSFGRDLMDPHSQLKKSITCVPELTPFFGSKIYETFADTEKSPLFKNFVIFMAEAVALLEQLFLFSSRKYFKEKSVRTRLGLRVGFEPEITLPEATRKMVREEYIHLIHFQKFLRTAKELDWPKQSLFLRRRHGLRRALMRVVAWEPLCILVPAAKLELFSLAYSRLLLKHAPADEAWTQLNRNHVMDEVHHVALDYEWAEIEVGAYSWYRKLRWTLATVAFVLVLQVLIFTAWSEVMARGLNVKSRWVQFWWGLRGIKWGVVDFVASKETKIKVKQYFQTKAIPSRRFLSFMHW